MIKLRLYKEDFELLMVMMHNENLLDEDSRESLLSFMSNEFKRNIDKMSELDLVYLEFDEHPLLQRLYTWIILAKPHWLM